MTREDSRKDLVISPEDEALIAAALRKVKASGKSPEGAAGATLGQALRRYEDKLPARMTGDMRLALREFVGNAQEVSRGTNGRSAPEPPPAPYGSERETIFARELAQLDAEGVTGWQRAVRLEGIVAGIRAEAQLREGAAAELRAAALRSEAEGAVERQQAIGAREMEWEEVEPATQPTK